MKADVRQICKVLVAGPVGVGKTTAVRSASDVPVLTTEATPTDETRLRKPSTTVAMDFGVLQLNRTQTIHIYGTPGQRRFNFMWDILAGGSAGVILLVDGSNVDLQDELTLYIDAFASLATSQRLALGVTRREPKNAHSLNQVHEHLEKRKLALPVFDADPRSRHDIVVLIRALLAASHRKSSGHDR